MHDRPDHSAIVALINLCRNENMNPRLRAGMGLANMREPRQARGPNVGKWSCWSCRIFHQHGSYRPYQLLPFSLPLSVRYSLTRRSTAGGRHGLMKTYSISDGDLLRQSCVGADCLHPCPGFAIRAILKFPE